MLNITENSINKYVSLEDFNSYRKLKKSRIKRLVLIMITSLLIAIILALFLPWTQNVRSKGYVTTRLPENRPQSIQSVISGKLEKWYIKEGDFVERGDTIAFISEVKSEYFDPELIQRTQEQADAKTQSIETYRGKADALKDQYNALIQARDIKISQTENKILQTKNKIKIDSIDLIAAEQNLVIAENQVARIKGLYEKGLKSLSELQEKELKIQSQQAKTLAQRNKLINSRNELQNVILEKLGVEKEYADKLAKSMSERQSALSAGLESQAQSSKLRNQVSNYSARQKFYYITAPQTGYVIKTIKKGLGEILKEGADLATIMPQQNDLAVEIYLKPQDIPLIQVGEEVRIRFDGWPAIVISGWPEASTGVFTGSVSAIDRNISDNGFYRILITPMPDPDTGKNWPPELKVGAGAQAFILLADVPIWYEIWRQLNGFPPDYYKDGVEKDEVKRKAPIKSIK